MDKNPQQQPVGSPVKVSRKKRWLLGGGMVLVLLLGVVVLSWLLRQANTANNGAKSPGKVAVSHVCTPDIINEANAPLAASDQVALAPVVDKITALKEFDHDPNCLYVVLQYNLAAGDAKASSDTMSKLDRVYNPVVGFSKAFTGSLISVTSLRQNVAFLVQNAKQSQANAKLGDERTAEGSDAADKFQQERK